MRILVLEEEKQIQQLISSFLSDRYLIDFLDNPFEVEKSLRKHHYQLFIADIHTLKPSLKELFQFIDRKEIALPCLFLTFPSNLMLRDFSQSDLLYEVLAMPFSFFDFERKIKILLERKAAQPIRSDSVESELVFDSLRKRCFFCNREIMLTKKEWTLLETFWNNRERVLSREYLVEAVWQDERFLIGNTLEVNISTLRRKLSPQYFRNIKGRGYCFSLKKKIKRA